MKKFIFAIATLVLGVAVANAGPRTGGNPKNDDGSSAMTSDYLGVDQTALSFSSTTVQLFTGEGVIIGFIASSNTALTDFVAIKDTDTVLASFAGATTNDVARVYLSSYATPGVIQLGTTYKFPAPIRVKRGAVVWAPTNTVPLVTWLYNKFGL